MNILLDCLVLFCKLPEETVTLHSFCWIVLLCFFAKLTGNSDVAFVTLFFYSMTLFFAFVTLFEGYGTLFEGYGTLFFIVRDSFLGVHY